MKTSCAALLFVVLSGTALFAAGGTSIVASPGQKAYISPTWPEGVGDLVNDPARTAGWNSWFSEWPNDVNQYEFEIKNMKDVNRLVEKLAAVKAPLRQVRLAPLKEPQGLGWVTRLPKGNGVAVILSIGDQARVDEWYKQVRKPFGVIEFVAASVAVPPTLTIFVQNDVVDLDSLKLPKGISASAGYVPTEFHRWNTKQEKQQKEKAAAKSKSDQGPELDPEVKAAAHKIDVYLNKYNGSK
jgi:hypothetical protein